MEPSRPNDEAQQQLQPPAQLHPLHPQHAHLPPPSVPMRTSHSTPMTSPGLFSPSGTRHHALAANPSSLSESTTPLGTTASPYLHPLQTYRVRETHKALIDSDNITGRKLINQYEVIEELGRGMHGKVKLARNLETGDNVAIKIIPRFSKKRRLGKVTAMSPQDKTKKEIAILKKIRHPNVVALLEVIDDPELKKIYMVLEHVELGEINWRRKGLPHICLYERRRVEREMRGENPSPEEEKYNAILERRQAIKELKRAKMAQKFGNTEYWSVEHGAADEGSSGPSAGPQSRIQSREDFAILDDPPSRAGSRPSSKAPSRTASAILNGEPPDLDEDVNWDDDMVTPVPNGKNVDSMSGVEGTGLEGTMYGAYLEDSVRGRSPSMADSIISHMSSVDFNEHSHDVFTDDYSYVPCFTIEQARSTFRDTVLGLEYLHYQGVVHRDIKPANLLWTRDHRVKISDFGVSYFGRPIRESEAADAVSESEARDFDDDLELAKTVGTPAFFAPELCYTDPDKEQLKVSEQIDVWSLGVTLYCLIYARIPFLAEDEFQMFRKIATEDVYIPTRRLKPVNPSASPSTQSPYQRPNMRPFRGDSDLSFEEIDSTLIDLLRQMLVKNPEKRIRLRDIKRHAWVVDGIDNVVGWLDDTDPARPSSGRRIQVDERDLSAAVVPLTLLERARSVVKKAVGKVIHPLVERGDSRSRRRAASSVASSSGENVAGPSQPGSQYRSERRRSLRPDDYFFNSGILESPLTESTHESTATGTLAADATYDPMATVLLASDDSREHSRSGSVERVKDDDLSRPARIFHRHGGSLGGKLNHRLSLLGHHMLVPGAQTMPGTPNFDGSNEGTDGNDSDHPRRARAMESVSDDNVRSLSVDRGLFGSVDKRAQAHVAVDMTVAPGSIQGPRRPRAMKSVDLSKTRHRSSFTASASSSPQPRTKSQDHRRSFFEPNLENRLMAHFAERPRTTHRVEDIPDAKSPPQRTYNTSNADSFAKAKEILYRKQELEMKEQAGQSVTAAVDPVNIPCPPSPDDDEFAARTGISRGETMTSAKSWSTDSMAGVGTPLTTPSETTSPVSSYTPKNTTERMMVFHSDPSLPALLSGASSVSADLEGELLGKPGVVSTQPALLETTDSLTPPAINKEPANGFPLDEVFENPSAMASGHLTVKPELMPSRSSTMDTVTPRSTRWNDDDDDDDDDDGSDDGILLMAKSKKKVSAPVNQAESRPFETKRRDTNISIASNETAKRAYADEERATSPSPS